MKRYLLPSALILALGLTYALAQTITKSIQLTQAANGVIGMDSTNNVYFPTHVLNLGLAPAVSSCGGGTPAIAGSDFAGVVTLGTSATGCIITFKKAYAATPWCVVSSQSAAVAVSPFTYSVSPTAITEVQPSTSSNLINYICSGSK